MCQVPRKGQRWSRNLLVIEASPKGGIRGECTGNSQGPIVQTGKLILRAHQAKRVWWNQDLNPGLAHSCSPGLSVYGHKGPSQEQARGGVYEGGSEGPPMSLSFPMGTRGS